MNKLYYLPLLLSFVTMSGEINANFYIKYFAFGLFFIFICMLSLRKSDEVINSEISISLPDFMILILGIIYSYYFIESCHNLDYYLPILYFLFYFLSRFLYAKIWIDKLISVSPIIISFHLLICILQYISVVPNFNVLFKVGSTFGNPDILSSNLAVLLPFCYLGNKNVSFRWMVTLMTFVLFFTLQSRTAILAVTITAFVYLFNKKKIKKNWSRVIVLLIIVLTILLICWYPKSVLGRFYIWIVSINMLIINSFGWGMHAFDKYYPEFQSNFAMLHQKVTENLNYDIVHSSYNEFLNIGITLGVIGLIFYVIFVLYILFKAYKIDSPLFYPLLTCQIISMFYFPFKIIPLTALYILCCTIVVSDNTFSPFKLFLSLRLKKIFLCVVCGIATFCFVTGLYSYLYWQGAVKQSLCVKTYFSALQKFEKCYPLMKDNGRFLISYAELRYKLGHKKDAFALMHQAENCFSDIAFLHNLAMIYEEEGKIAEAKNKLNMALYMSPNNIPILIAQIQFLQRIGEYDEANRINNLILIKK